MKTKIFKLTEPFGDSVSIKVRKPSLVEKVQYQNSIRDAKTETERLNLMMEAGLKITEEITESSFDTGKKWKEKLKSDFDDALIQIAYLMYQDSKVEDISKSGVEPNFSKTK